MDRRTNIVHKPRQGQFSRARASAGTRFRFKNCSPKSSSRQENRRGETVGPRADDKRVSLFQIRVERGKVLVEERGPSSASRRKLRL